MLNVNTPVILSMTPDDASDGAVTMASFADKYRKEPDFRARMEEDPVAVFAGYGIEMPAGTDIRLVEDTAEVFHFTLPFEPHADLTDEQLDWVAGGTGYAPDMSFLGAPRRRVMPSIRSTPLATLYRAPCTDGHCALGGKRRRPPLLFQGPRLTSV